MSAVVAFFGLGTMGGPMAGRLLSAGFEVRGYDVDANRLAEFERAGGKPCEDVASACAGAEVAISMLPRDEHVRAVLLGADGVRSHLSGGAMVIEMSTISPRTSIEIGRELTAAGLRMLDAPVGRTPEDARRGTLLVMAGGERTDFEQARPLFDAMADKVLHMGPAGSGIRMKVANNYMTMVGMVLTAETLTLAAKAGIDRAAAVEVLQNTVAGRGQINTNFPKKVLAGDISPDFPLSLGLKDLSLALGLGQELGAPLFLGGSARELFGLAGPMGRSAQDCTAMLHILEALAGLPTDIDGGH